MPKAKWTTASKDDALTAGDIDSAEMDAGAYTGDLPPGGVYRFILKRSQVKTFGSNNMGFNSRLVLDGSWKEAHAKYDGCPLWDRVVLTKAAAAFVKAWAVALGVTSADLISNTVLDAEGYVTSIGKRKIDGQDIPLYVSVKQDPNPEYTARLTKAGTGYVVVTEEQAASAPAAEVPAGKKAKGGKKGKKATTDEPPF